MYPEYQMIHYFIIFHYYFITVINKVNENKLKNIL